MTFRESGFALFLNYFLYRCMIFRAFFENQISNCPIGRPIVLDAYNGALFNFRRCRDAFFNPHWIDADVHLFGAQLVVDSLDAPG